MIFRWAAFINPSTIRSLSLLQKQLPKLWRHLCLQALSQLQSSWAPESTKGGRIDLIRAIYENDDEMKLFPKTIQAILIALLLLISGAGGERSF